MATDPDAEFLLDGIINGFKIIDGTASLQPAEVDNYSSATGAQVKDKVEAAIINELAQGHYQIVHSKPTIVSALGAVPKDDGADIRLIHDCSRPKGAAVNDYVSNLKVKYQTFNEAIGTLKPNYYMAKIDLKSAYRSVKLHPSCYQATGLKWTFKGHSESTYMIDTRFPFGSKVAKGWFILVNA